MPYYKYMKKEHLSGFFEKGTLRIGTLYDFREEELYNESIADIHEGKRYVSHEYGPEPSSLDNHPTLTKWQESMIQGSGNVTFSNIKLIQIQSSKNLYIFCTSLTFDKKMMTDSFEYDCCLEITDKRRFIRAISREISALASFVDSRNVSYRDEHYGVFEKQDIHPAFQKRTLYQNQTEHRMIWQPIIDTTNQEISPFLIDVPDARRFCREVV